MFLLSVPALAACHAATPVEEAAATRPGARAVHAATDRFDRATSVACGLGGSPLDQHCGVEQATTPAGEVLTLRRPDGGFRRLLIANDGRGVIAADGAQAARVTIVAPGRIEVAIADERYRLPATIVSPGSARP